MHARPMFALVFGLAGCSATMQQSDQSQQQVPTVPAPDAATGTTPVGPCPIDPDCGWSNQSCDPFVCPDFWTCQELGGGHKRCTSVGPEYPDSNGGWVCEDTPTTTVCRRGGGAFPDAGGGGDWNCHLEGEFVVCTSGTPDYPDEGAGGPWNCHFQNETRVCENDPNATPVPDENGWTCYDVERGRECRRDVGTPDDRGWQCNGNTCFLFNDPTPPDSGDEWDCVNFVDQQLCTLAESLPDESSPTEWNCYMQADAWVCNNEPPCQEVCVAGTTRYCDEPNYCHWGTQVCAPDGTWGACIETTNIPSQCAGSSSIYDQQCCIDAGQCCQNYWGVDPSRDRNASTGNCTTIVQEVCPAG